MRREILPEFLIVTNYANLNIFSRNLSFKPKSTHQKGRSEGATTLLGNKKPVFIYNRRRNY